MFFPNEKNKNIEEENNKKMRLKKAMNLTKMKRNKNELNQKINIF